MKLLSLIILAALFIGLPVYLLNVMVMPQLQTLHGVYAHADQTAAHIAGTSSR